MDLTGELTRLWRTAYPESMATSASISFVDLISDHDPPGVIGAAIREAIVLDSLADVPLPRMTAASDGSIRLRDRFRAGFFGSAHMELREQMPPEDTQLRDAQEMIMVASGALGEQLLRQIAAVQLVRSSIPFLAGTDLAFPRCVFLEESLSTDTTRLAEHLYHEAVHICLYKSYFERTPLARGYVTGGQSARICAVWHNPNCDDGETTWWWGPERSLHAFLVFAHLIGFWISRRRSGDESHAATSGLRSTLFCAGYLGAQLRAIADDCFSAPTGELVNAAVDALPTTGRIESAVRSYTERGLQWSAVPIPPTEMIGPNQVQLVRHDPAHRRTYAIVDALPFALEWSGAEPRGMAATRASASHGRAAVDGLVLRHMINS